ncbi:MAG: rRNA maturation RNase YbeY [Limisphaerales bacterium]
MNVDLLKSRVGAPRVAIANRQRTRNLDLRGLKKIFGAVLAELEFDQADLGVVLLGVKEMASLNERFLGHTGPTDVITFDYRNFDSKVPAGRDAIRRHPAVRQPKREKRPAQDCPRGEIFICVPEAERQARAFGTGWKSEIIRYFIHGVLHLSGYDDLQPAARKRMKREENRLTRKLAVEGRNLAG